MNNKVQDLLKKINYIEADIEIQKQILFDSQSGDEAELERIIGGIATKKEEINLLREQIKVIDPEEYNTIIRFEKASDEFKKLATEKKFVSIESMNPDQPCFLTLENDEKIPCLVKACEDNGDYTIMTLEGNIQHYSSTVVAKENSSSSSQGSQTNIV